MNDEHNQVVRELVEHAVDSLLAVLGCLGMGLSYLWLDSVGWINRGFILTVAAFFLYDPLTFTFGYFTFRRARVMYRKGEMRLMFAALGVGVLEFVCLWCAYYWLTLGR
jgi:hypothetical protein